MLNGEYGESDIYAGVPAVITCNGIKELVTYHLEEHELAEFKQSLQLLKQVNQQMMASLNHEELCE